MPFYKVTMHWSTDRVVEAKDDLEAVELADFEDCPDENDMTGVDVVGTEKPKDWEEEKG